MTKLDRLEMIRAIALRPRSNTVKYQAYIRKRLCYCKSCIGARPERAGMWQSLKAQASRELEHALDRWRWAL